MSQVIVLARCSSDGVRELALVLLQSEVKSFPFACESLESAKDLRPPHELRTGHS